MLEFEAESSTFVDVLRLVFGSISCVFGGFRQWKGNSFYQKLKIILYTIHSLSYKCTHTVIDGQL